MKKTSSRILSMLLVLVLLVGVLPVSATAADPNWPLDGEEIQMTYPTNQIITAVKIGTGSSAYLQTGKNLVGRSVDGSDDDLTTFKFEKTSTAGQYYITITFNGVKYYLRNNNHEICLTTQSGQAAIWEASRSATGSTVYDIHIAGMSTNQRAYLCVETGDNNLEVEQKNKSGHTAITVQCADPVTVTFNLNYSGAPAGPATQTLGSGNTATEPTAPTRAGYTFGGWYTNSACGDNDAFSFSTPVTQDIILYAKWTPSTYTVTYNGNGGTYNGAATRTVTVNVGTNHTVATDAYGFTQTDYVFDGWYLEAACVTKAPEKVSDAKTLYAKWKPEAKWHVTYSWTFDPADSSANFPSTETLPSDSNVYAKGDTWAVTGTYSAGSVVNTYDDYGNVNGTYTFSGWKLNDTVVTGGTINGNVTLTGVWTFEEVEVPEYTVSYEWSVSPAGSPELPSTTTKPSDSGKYVKGQEYTVNADYSAGSVVKTYDDYGNVNGKFTFSGWKLNDTVVTGKKTMGEGNVTLTGVWTYEEVEVPEYTVTYDWASDSETPDDVDLPTGGSYVNNQPYTVATGLEPVQVKTEYGNVCGVYTFEGWTLDGKDVTGTEQKMGESDITIYGKWTYEAKDVDTELYTVNHYLYSNGQYSLISTQSGFAELNSPLSYTTFVLNNDFYRFAWAEPETLTISATTQNVMNLYYTRVMPDVYTVTYDLNGGTISYGSFTYYDENVVFSNLIYGDPTPTIGTPVREGYTFLGWSPAISATVKGSAYYTAMWLNNGGVPSRLNGKDHYAYVVGYPDGTVRPEANITRAEVASIFFRLLNEDERNYYMTKYNAYSDVNYDDWFCTAVSTLSRMGILSGYEDGTFRPDAYITRAEFAAIAARFDEHGYTSFTYFTDTVGHWAQREIGIAANNGWVSGYLDGTFRPDNYITRAEAMSLINRVLQRIPETVDDLLPGMNIWIDNLDVNAWYYLAVQEATNSHDYRAKAGGYETWRVLRADPNWAAIEQ